MAPLQHEPFVSRQPPRCLVGPRHDADGRGRAATPTILRRAEWPLRVNFRHWALKLLTTRASA
jgi:hypothetical protein